MKMREKLTLFENLPLFGKSIIVTRSASQSGRFSEQLSILGAEVIHCPTIEIKPPESFQEMDECLRQGHIYDWVIFTSVNGVRSFESRMKELDLDIRLFNKAKFAGIGAASRKAIKELGVRVDFVPEKFTAKGFVTEFQQIYPDLKGVKVLFPAANIAREAIPEKLTELGAEVTRLTAYQTVAPEHNSKELLEMFEQNIINLVTFTSSSTAENFLALFNEKEKKVLRDIIKTASIGPMTSNTLRNYGIEPLIEPEKHTIPGLVEGIVNYYKMI